MAIHQLIATAFVISLSTTAVWAGEPVDYLRDVKPLLAARCFSCHGALSQKSGLRLDTAALLRKGGESGSAIEQGNPAESRLIQALNGTNGFTRMPPESEGEALKPEEIDRIRRWIEQGAKAPENEQPEKDPREHWAFQRPLRKVPLRVTNSSTTNPIDAWLNIEHQRHGLTPQPEAERSVLLRRVYLDLIGLPPSIEDQQSFAQDDSPDALERVVDRLLSSPQYGERWGRHFMDVWRYSDWWGLGAELRNSAKHIWHWRDWIIESLNSDKGYDQMLREMIAADELYPEDLDKLRATGFLVRSYFKFNRNTWLEDVVEHTSKSFLGMTFNCAKCHDHKYDPIRHDDYYQFRAIFEPYQVRTDAVAGETDFEKNGLPRVFDCNLDTPTFRFTRGDERRPEKDKPLRPAVPAVFGLGDLSIKPVTLPTIAHQPGLRPFVLDDQLQQAEQQLATARQAVVQAKQQLKEAESLAAKRAAEKPEATDTTNVVDSETTTEIPKAPVDLKFDKPLFAEDFSNDKLEAWEKLSGDWAVENGKLVQKQDGSNRAAIRWKTVPPTNFQARLKFMPTGGQMWKSVGIAFDVADGHELLVYLSAYAGGSKLQIAFKQGGDYVYPSDGAQARPVMLGQPQDLVIRVRGPLINVFVNGEFALAHQLPISRRSGFIDLITYDAKATIERYEVANLPKTIKFVAASGATTPSSAPKPLTVEQATLSVAVAEKTLFANEAAVPALKARAAADRAKFQQPPAEDAKSLAAEAAKLEKQIELLKAEAAVAAAELELSRTDTAKKMDSDKKLAAAKTALENARKALESPGENYTSLRGSLKQLESNLEKEDSRLKPYPTTSSGRRTALAEWITDPKHPLPARVLVNHVWLRHFGRPLVPTVFEFGRKGQEPTHPELLDWLAVELQESGWSLKHLHRLIVTSQAYRRTSSSVGNEASRTADSENRWYWRMNSKRMEAQVVRDAQLALAGNLDERMFGPSIPVAADDSSKRRSLYFVHSHNEHHKFLALFDDAGVQECYRRSESIVPQQALAMTNSAMAIASAEQITARLQQTYETSSDSEFIRAAFELLIGCQPTHDERTTCEQALSQLRVASPAAASSRVRHLLIQVLLNHNDFVTIR